MLKHPFFKYSFVTLLIIDLCFTAGLILFGISTLSLPSLLASMIWFICFYWIPVWLAAIIILTLRDKDLRNTILEWTIAVLVLTLGAFVTEQVLAIAFNTTPFLGNFVYFGGLTWATPLYFITRFIESKRKISTEQQARKQAQLETLRYQLNPHFMFNSLNTISAYIHTKPDLADEVLHELADILRYSLDTADTKRISIQQEIAIIKKYCNIEKARFGDRLSLIFDIPADLNKVQVPPLMLQPIIENAIKHSAKQTHLEITVKIHQINNLLKITITDNGSGFNQEVLTLGYGKGIGMKNLQQRMAQLEKGKVILSNNNGAVIDLEMAV